MYDSPDGLLLWHYWPAGYNCLHTYLKSCIDIGAILHSKPAQLFRHEWWFKRIWGTRRLDWVVIIIKLYHMQPTWMSSVTECREFHYGTIWLLFLVLFLCKTCHIIKGIGTNVNTIFLRNMVFSVVIHRLVNAMANTIIYCQHGVKNCIHIWAGYFQIQLFVCGLQ